MAPELLQSPCHYRRSKDLTIPACFNRLERWHEEVVRTDMQRSSHFLCICGHSLTVSLNPVQAPQLIHLLSGWPSTVALSGPGPNADEL